MATFLRTLFVGKVDATNKVDDLELEFLVDVGLSNPFNKRYSKPYKNGMNIKQLFDDMTSELNGEEIITLSNGTKTVKATVKVWSNNFNHNLTTWITDDKNPEQNVFINVDGKNLKADVEVKVSKL